MTPNKIPRNSQQTKPLKAHIKLGNNPYGEDVSNKDKTADTNNKIPQEIEEGCGRIVKNNLTGKNWKCGTKDPFFRDFLCPECISFNKGFQSGQKQKVNDVLKLIDNKLWLKNKNINTVELEELKAQIKNGGNDERLS